MQADEAAAAEEESRLAAEAEKLQQQAKDRHAAREKLRHEIKRAELEAINRHRKIIPSAITHKTAIEVAQALLRAFEDVDQPREGSSAPVGQRAAQLWDAIDDARCRLLTADVDEDARATVLAIEGVVDACDDWERHRQPAAIEARGADGKPLVDLQMQTFPHESSLVRQLTAELQRVLDGEEAAPLEGIGRLIADGVSLRQISLMHGLVMADNSPDMTAIGSLIERALAGTPRFFEEVNSWSHLKRLGAMNAADAWAIRAANLQSRRESSSNTPGSPQLAGTVRPGRLAQPSADASPTEPQDVRFSLYRQQQAEAARAAANSQSGQPVSADGIRAGLHAAMSRRP